MSRLIRWNGSDAAIDFGGGVSVEIVDAVVDLGAMGDIIGVEVLGLVEKHPALVSSEVGLDGAPEVAVDPDADATYVRLASGRSIDQVVGVAAVAFNRADQIVAVTVRMER